MSPLAERVLACLRASIAKRGGKGRRPSTIEMEMPAPVLTFEQVARGCQELEAVGLVRFEHNEIMGWYVVLREAEQ